MMIAATRIYSKILLKNDMDEERKIILPASHFVVLVFLLVVLLYFVL